MKQQKEMSLYCAQMEEIINRDGLLRLLLDGKKSLGSEFYDYEVFALNIRKILELIAFSSLIAAKDQYALKHKKFHQHYKSKNILEEIEKINPKFFPTPGAIEDKNDGSKHVELPNTAKNALTRKEFEELYDYCSSVIHAWKPFNSAPKKVDFKIAPIEWLNKIRDLLNVHYVYLPDDKGVWLCLMQPRFLLLENVKGFKAAFKQNGTDKEKVYAEVVKEKLEKLGYCVFHQMCNASRFGVPQPRARFIMIAHKKGESIIKSPFETLEEFLPEYRYSKGLHKTKDTTVKAAISDLEINGTAIMPSVDTNNFNQIHYKKRKLTAYQKLMRQDCNDNHEPNSLRLARHNDETLRKFNVILKKYPKGKSLTKAELLSLGTKKQCFTPLHPDMTSRTITTLPDDLLHYSEPRILTVRENARIQSFPDWFDFLGKYTTGGARRKEECPRYSQVGNAVPPLMAEGLGLVIKKVGGIDGY